MAPWMKAISDEKGNLFVLDDSDFTMLHDTFVSILNRKGEIQSSSNYESMFSNLVLWQQVGHTNDFYLSESYGAKDVDHPHSLSVYLNHIKKLTKKVKQTNPQFNFHIERVWDVFKEPMTDSEMESGRVTKK